jgi:hypothetical protein
MHQAQKFSKCRANHTLYCNPGVVGSFDLTFSMPHCEQVKEMVEQLKELKSRQ